MGVPYRESWSTTMLRAWGIVWMLAVPLIHIHPEADPHHGEIGHIHGGTVHTVFSPDLDGEFADHRAASGFGRSSAHAMAVADHSPHAEDYTELGFSFLSDSTDRKLPKPQFAPAVVMTSGTLPILAPSAPVARTAACPPLLRPPAHTVPSRAPPVSLA